MLEPSFVVEKPHSLLLNSTNYPNCKDGLPVTHLMIDLEAANELKTGSSYLKIRWCNSWITALEVFPFLYTWLHMFYQLHQLYYLVLSICWWIWFPPSDRFSGWVGTSSSSSLYPQSTLCYWCTVNVCVCVKESESFFKDFKVLGVLILSDALEIWKTTKKLHKIECRLFHIHNFPEFVY